MYQTSGRVAAIGIEVPNAGVFHARVDQDRPLRANRGKISSPCREAKRRTGARGQKLATDLRGSRSVTMISKRKERRGQSRKLDREIGRIARRTEQFSSRCCCKPCASGAVVGTPKPPQAERNGETSEKEQEVGNPVSSIGIRKIHPPITTKVRTRTTRSATGASRDRQKDGQQIHAQHERPDQKRNFGQVKDRHQNQHQRKRGKRWTPPLHIDLATRCRHQSAAECKSANAKKAQAPRKGLWS